MEAAADGHDAATQVLRDWSCAGVRCHQNLRGLHTAARTHQELARA